MIILWCVCWGEARLGQSRRSCRDLGKNGVCSNYSPEHVTYTWECLQRLKSGSRAVFTQRPLPFKCPGAPQKIVYVVADHLQHRGILKDCSLNYMSMRPSVIFGWSRPQDTPSECISSIIWWRLTGR
jgi:hypothetical protein